MCSSDLITYYSKNSHICSITTRQRLHSLALSEIESNFICIDNFTRNVTKGFTDGYRSELIISINLQGRQGNSPKTLKMMKKPGEEVVTVRDWTKSNACIKPGKNMFVNCSLNIAFFKYSCWLRRSTGCKRSKTNARRLHCAWCPRSDQLGPRALEAFQQSSSYISGVSQSLYIAAYHG